MGLSIEDNLVEIKRAARRKGQIEVFESFCHALAHNSYDRL
jgi:hypothetical protein